RPFSIFQARNGELGVFFQVAGRGTARLAGLRPGDKVRVTGPLGRGFVFAPDKSVLLLAGGMGLAPFWSYAERHSAAGDLRLLFGHRMPLDCYPYALVRNLIRAEHFMERTPEDRTAFLRRTQAEMEEQARQGGLTLACGPTPFLRTVQSWAICHGVETQISLENSMACGVGACLGCVVKTLPEQTGGQGAKHAPPPEFHQGLPVSSCRCGPVFWADAVDLTEAG
ncbi:MAG: dihydroorotate dehydrogenase electron transfer subunit, partial [Deltaproteobacteria bacterium]|nr:dihydroorotate dehydrogenase electron transfer subunit [Deltaproteobacteria bacterium]